MVGYSIIILIIILLVIITVIITGLLLLFGGLGVGSYFILKKMSSFIKTIIIIIGYIIIAFAGLIVSFLCSGLMLGSIVTIVGVPIGVIIMLLFAILYIMGIIVGGIFLFELGLKYKLSMWQYPIHIILTILIPGYGFGLPFQFGVYELGGQPYALEVKKD